MSGLSQAIGGLTLLALITGGLASNLIVFKVDFNQMSGLFRAGLGGFLGTGGGAAIQNQPICNNGVCFQPDAQQRQRSPRTLNEPEG